MVLGKASATSLEGWRSLMRTEHLAPSPYRFVVGRAIIFKFVIGGIDILQYFILTPT